MADAAVMAVAAKPPSRAHPARLTPRDLLSRFAADAECRYDPELHTGTAGPEPEESRRAREQVAREVCSSCPARVLCLRYALATVPVVGVYAGFTADEIADLREALADMPEAA